MRKKLLLSIVLLLIPSFAQAKTYIDENGFKVDFGGVSRVYYGVMDTHKKEVGKNNLPNRKINRTDTNFKASYDFNSDYTFTLHNRSALIFKEHDKNYRNGEWRFYTYGNLTTPYGQFSAGDTFNVAHQFHKGAVDFGPLGVTDSNLTYFLSNPNWSGGKKSVAFYTPKSTAMMNDGRAMKINYITPKYKDTLLGFTYTPNNEHRRGMVSRYSHYDKKKDGYVFAVHNEQSFDFGDLYTSAGYGIFNRTDKELSLGMTLKKGGWSYALGYKNAYVDGDKNQITTTNLSPQRKAFYDNYRESEAWDASIGFEISAYKVSVAYLHTEAKNTSHEDDTFIFSNAYTFNKWVDIYLVGAYINARGVDKSDSNRNKGYAAIGGLGLKF